MKRVYLEAHSAKVYCANTGAHIGRVYNFSFYATDTYFSSLVLEGVFELDKFVYTNMLLVITEDDKATIKVKPKNFEPYWKLIEPIEVAKML